MNTEEDDKYKYIHIQYEISLLLSHISSEKDLYKLLEIICKFDGIDSGGLYILNQENKSLNLIAHTGFEKEFIDNVSYYSSDSYNVDIVNKGKPIYDDDPIKIQISNYSIKSTAIIPIHHNDKPIGCLNLASHTYDIIPMVTREILESISLNLGGSIVRIKSEQLLKDSDRNFSSLFNTIEDFLFILDESGNILEVNNHVKIKLGYSDEDLKNMNVIFIHPEDRREEASIIINNMLIGTEDVCPIPLICKNGSMVPVETKVVRGMWNNKNALFGISRDISKHMEYDISLQNSLKRQILLADITQKLNTFDDLNEHIQETLKIIGEHIGVSRVYIFEDKNGYTSNTYEWCNDKILSQKNNLQNIEIKIISNWYDILKTDGKIFTNDIKTLPEDIFNILDPQEIKSIVVLPLDNKTGMFGFIGFDECTRVRTWEKDEVELLRTISNIISGAFSRINYEKELINSHYFSDNLINMNNVMVIGLDLNGNVNLFNKSAENITSYKKEEVFGRNWFNDIPILSKEVSPKMFDIFNGIIHDNEYKMYEYPIITKYGEIKYILWQNNKDVKFDKTTGAIYFGLDISERRKFEQELINAKDKAEQSDKMKLEFISNMSHDLRTPMNSIIGFSDLLKSNNLTKYEKNDYIDTIINNGKFLMALIDDIIDISKIDAGSLGIENKDFELNKLMEELRLSYSKQIKDKNIEIIIDVDINKNIIIHSDKYRTRQILMNLIGNAIKFTNDGYVKFGYKILNSRQLEVYVEDTGPGIERQYQRVIFERFKQIGKNNKFKGAGLGLSISKSLVELLGFKEIRLISELDSGSKFYFIMPYEIKHYNYINDMKNGKNGKNKKMNFSGKNILIVEDDDESRLIMKIILNQTGVNVIELIDGKNVVDTIKNEDIDLVLLDVGLPFKSGYEVLKDIRKYDNRLPVIIESAIAMSDQRSKAFELGCDDFISKPFSKEDFLNKIDNLI